MPSVFGVYIGTVSLPTTVSGLTTPVPIYPPNTGIKGFFTYIFYQHFNRYSNNIFHIARASTFKWAALYTLATWLTSYIVLVTGVHNKHSTLVPYVKALLKKTNALL
jgi:hypothetical protein